jgi:hypothetical protein
MPRVFHWWSADADITTKWEGLRDDWVVADLAASFDVLQSHEAVDGERIGILLAISRVDESHGSARAAIPN